MNDDIWNQVVDASRGDRAENHPHTKFNDTTATAVQGFAAIQGRRPHRSGRGPRKGVAASVIRAAARLSCAHNPPQVAEDHHAANGAGSGDYPVRTFYAVPPKRSSGFAVGVVYAVVVIFTLYGITRFATDLALAITGTQ